jgi:hypothetical protein
LPARESQAAGQPGAPGQPFITESNQRRKGSGYGFQGDPLRPIPGKYYGYFIRAGLY